MELEAMSGFASEPSGTWALPGRTMVHPEVAFRTVFQPILDLANSGVVGYEALTRFEDGVSPDHWLADATARGSGVELETLLARAGIQAADGLPAGVWLGLNVSSNLIRAGRALRTIVEPCSRPVVLEVDAAQISGPMGIDQTVTELPDGVALAISGVHPGYDCLTLVREVVPSFVKLDRNWVSSLDTDSPKQALIGALVAVAGETGCTLIAEGIETEAELRTLQELGVRFGQGYLLGRPRELSRG
jgi:EAL domain-containing protein (putative c-di-GMP-specific phosphodiesterase class I)